MRILIIDPVHDVLPQSLMDDGHIVDIHYAQRYKFYFDIISQYDGIILRSGIRINQAFIDAAAQLKFIARVGAGMENIDVAYAESKGIRCINSPEGNRSAVGEQAVGMLLSLFNNLRQADAEVRQAIWQREENRGIEIEGKTVGIIGYGNMGSAFAQRLSGFGAEVIAYDKYKTNFSNQYVREVEMQEIFEHSNIVSLHLPLTDETNYLVNKEWLSKFRKNIYLINTARGSIVNTEDLVRALD